MVNSSGAMAAQYVYTPYGVEEPYNASGNPYRYTGRRLEAEWGLFHYRARYYDPALGRFYQTDPVLYADQFNLYAYVGNDPLNRTDPTGMELQFEFGPGGSKEQYIQATDYLSGVEEGSAIVSEFETRAQNSSETFSVRIGTDRVSSYNPANNTLHWNPEQSTITGEGDATSPAIGLIHEMGHGLEIMDRGRDQVLTDAATPVVDYVHENNENGLPITTPIPRGYNVAEQRVMDYFENPVSSALGEPVRGEYNNTAGWMRAPSPTSSCRGSNCAAPLFDPR